MSDSELDPEILVNISFRLPQLAAMDRISFAAQMVDVIRETIIIGGTTVHIGIQPYDPDESDD